MQRSEFRCKPELRCKAALAPWFDGALDYAISLVRTGVLVVDDDGRVWRHFVRTKTAMRPITPRRAETRTKKGYLAVVLCVPGTRITRHVLAHVLVWTLAHGRIPEGLQINHKDLDKANNRLSNLELTTASGNIRHSYANGRTRPWSHATEWRPGIPRRSAEDVAEIFRLLDSGLSQRAVCKQAAISRTHLCRLIQRRKEGAQ